MAFNIQEFSENIGRYGTLPVNKFEVSIPRPRALLSSYGLEASNLLRFRAERVNIPGIVFDSYESRRYGVGPSIKTAIGKSRFNEVTIEFIDTSEMLVAKFFYDWMYNIVDISGSGGALSRSPSFLAGYKEDYCVELSINVYNSTGTRTGSGGSIQPILIFDLIEAFPVSMADAGLAWSRTNEIHKTSITFAYTNHRLSQGSGSFLAIQNTRAEL
jgi:hypothetical protein